MYLAKNCLMLVLLVSAPVVFAAQFVDHFNTDNTPAENGWRSMSGDGLVKHKFVQENGFARFHVDSTDDRRNIWWAVIAHSLSKQITQQLVQHNYELRLEVKIKVSHAPRRVNLHVNHSRTTDYHSHLMEYDIPIANQWHTISMTTQGFDVQTSDTINAQMALMDWGLDNFYVDIDYFKVEVVNPNKAEKDVGNPQPYHPPLKKSNSFAISLPASHDSVIDQRWNDYNFNRWKSAEDEQASLLTVSGAQIAILRWDFNQCRQAKVEGSGLLELTTHTLFRSPEFEKDFGMVRIFEILDGDPEWQQDTVTYETFLNNKPISKVLNGQMVIDWSVAPAKGDKTWFALPQAVMQRLLNGTTKGIAIQPLGAVVANFYASELPNKGPRLLFNINNSSPSNTNCN